MTREKIDTISLPELMQLLKHSKATIDRHIKAGHLPRPISDNQYLFRRQDIAKKIGVDDLDEEFILIEEAAEILGFGVAILRSMCHSKHWPVPHYKLIAKRGSGYLFRRSELEKYKQVSLVKSCQCLAYEDKYNLLIEVFSSVATLAGSEFGCLSLVQANVLREAIVHGKQLPELAKDYVKSGESVRQTLIKAKGNLKTWLPRLNDYVVNSKKEIRRLIQENKHLKKENKALAKDIQAYEIDNVHALYLDVDKVLLSDLEVSTRIKYAAKALDVTFLDEFCEYTANDFLCLKNFGRVALAELKNKLAEHDLYLKQ